MRWLAYFRRTVKVEFAKNDSANAGLAKAESAKFDFVEANYADVEPAVPEKRNQWA